MTDFQLTGGQPDPDFMAALAASQRVPAQPRGMVAPTPTGPTGPLGYVEAPVAGYYQAKSALGSAAQGVAKLVGADDFAKQAADWAAQQRATAATYQNPDIEKYDWYDPRKIASQVLSGAPVLAGGALAGAGGFLVGGPAGAAVAAGAFGYPFAVGSNVETSEANYGDQLSKGQAAKALALGVPEAALGAWTGGRLGGMIAGGVKKAAGATAGEKASQIARAAASQAVVQGLASAGQDFIAQQMNDRSIPFRMSEMMQSILTGGVTGGLMGGGVHALAKTAPADVMKGDPEVVGGAIDNALNPQPKQLLLPPPSPVDQLGKPLQITNQSSNRLATGQVVPYFEQRPLPEDQVHAAPDVVNAPSPADIPVRPFQHLADEEVRQKARFLFDNGARPGDPALDALRQEWQIRTMVADQSAQRALPPPERVPAISPDLEGDRVHEPTTATVQTGFDAKGNPILASAPIKLGQTHVGESVAAPAPLAIEARAQGLGSQEPIPMPAPPHPLAEASSDQLRAAAKTAAKTAPTWLDTTNFAATQKSILTKLSPGPDDPPVRASTLKIAHMLADVFGVKDGTPEAPVSPAVAPLEALHTDPEVQASLTLAAKVGAALDTAKTPTPSPVATDIVAKLRAAKPKIVDAPTAAAPTPTQTSLDALKAMTDVAKPGLSPGAAKRVNTGWQAELTKDPTGQSAWDKYEGKLSPDAQAALEAHGNVVEDAKAKVLPGERPSADRPQTQAGVDIEHVVDNGGSLKDALTYLQQNGGSGLEKTLANTLLKHGVDAPMRVADDKLPPAAGAQYDPTAHQIDLRPGAASGQLVLHEAVHAATAKAIEAGGPAAKDMQQLYDTMKARSPDNDAYGLKNAHEFVAEAHTNPEFQDFLKSHPADPSLPEQPKTLWQAFKNVVAKIIGARPGAERTMLDQVLDTGNRLMGENKTAPETAGSPLYSPIDKIKQIFGVSDDVKSGVAAKIAETGTAGRKAVNGFVNARDIVNGVAKQVPSAQRWFNATETESNQKNTWNKSRAVAHNAYAALSQVERGQHDAAAAATYFGIDPRKPPGQQNPEFARAKNAADLARAGNDAYRIYTNMSDAAKAAFDMRVNTNQASRAAAFATAFDTAVKTLHPELTRGFENDPAHDYQMSVAGMKAQDDPALAKKFWTDEIDKRVASAKLGADATYSKLGVTPERLAKLRDLAAQKVVPSDAAGLAAQADARKQLKGLDSDTVEKAERLDRWVKGATDLKKSFDGVPYFRAGRGTGDYYAAGSIALDKTGMPSQAAIDAVRARLDKDGFKDNIIERANSNNKLYIKTDSQEKADRLGAALHDLQGQGHLSADDDVSYGKTENAVHHGVGPAVMQDIISTIRANRPKVPDGMDPDAAEQFLAAWDKGANDLTRDLMDTLSDSSPTKINARRDDVQGAAKEVGRSARETDANVSAMLARQSNATEKGAAIASMRDEMTLVNKSKMSTADKENIHNAITELLNREARKPTTPPNGLVNALTWVTRASEIGFNPAYFITLHAQDWTYSWGELGKTHGMVAAARELARAELPSIKVMRAMLQDPDWAFAGMRRSTLIKGGVPERDADFYTALDNAGGMTHGALTQSMFNTEGEGFRAKAAQISTAMGRYAEVQPRIKLARAARALWRGEAKDGPLLDFVLKKINGAQFDYSSENAPRQLTRAGMFGDFSPLVNQFMSYRTMATAKLYHEFHDLFSPKGSTPDETTQMRKEAGKFLAAHLAATTVLAGAMGLPMVAVFASVYDKIADGLTGSPTHDIMGSFRHFLTTTYGPTVGLALARGLPAAAGADLSHLGDQKIAPGSDMLMMWSEKRKWEDAEKDWLKNLAGSSAGLAMNWLLGARDIANGDYINGAVKMAPEAIKGPVEALRDGLYGYRNKSGTPLGVTPGGIDLALEAMGLDPTKKATMDLDKSVLTGLQTRRQIQSQNITQHLAKAVQINNPADLRYWEGQSAQAGRDWPGFAPPIAHLQRYLAEQAQQGGIARSLGAPFGTRPNDATSRGFFGGMLQPR